MTPPAAGGWPQVAYAQPHGRNPDRARAAQGARRRDDPRRRLGHGRARRRARRRRPERRRQVDAAADPRRPRAARPRDACGCTRRHRRLPAAGARPRARRAAGGLPRAPHGRGRGARAGRGGHRTSWRRTPRARRTATRRRSRLARARRRRPRAARRRRSCATSGSIPRCSTSRPTALSGGQAARASLAAILLSRFDVLLLDEPTNDLDFDGLARLERFVAERPGGAVIVSHDRAFLERDRHARARARRDRAHRRGVRRRLGRLPRAARDRRAPRRGALRRVRHRARPADRPRPPPAPVVGDRRAHARRTPHDPDKIGRAQARRALREAGGEGPRDREGDRAARRRSTSRGGAGSCSCASAAASAPATSPCGWSGAVLRRGRSSSARSTSSWRGASASRSSARTGAARRRWSTALLGRLPLAAGTRWVGPGVRLGDARPGAARVRRRRRAARRVRRAERAAAAGGALAAGQVRARARGRGTRRPASLSPGERTRASLALLMASGANWLVLDEPTNHLDLPAIEQLETALGRLRRHAPAGHPRPRSCSTPSRSTARSRRAPSRWTAPERAVRFGP